VLNMLKSGWEAVSSFVSDAYKGSFLESTYDGATDLYKGAQAWGKENPIASTFASSAVKSLTSKETAANLPKAKRPTIKSGVEAGSYASTATNMGYTARVVDKIRAVQNSKVGGSIQGTIDRLQTKPSRGPTLSITSPQISVKPRSR